MRFKKTCLLLGLASLTGFVTATPIAGPGPNPEVIAKIVAEVEVLKKRETNGAYCWRNRPWEAQWAYYLLVTWGEWDQDWGKGLIDNIKERCAHWTIKNWEFRYEEGVPPTNGIATVQLAPGGYHSRCVEDAVWAASNYAGRAIWGMNCNESDKWW